MIHEKIYLYESRKDVTLTTYVQEDSCEMLNGKKRPAVLICPGGAYLGCSDREGEPVALAFAHMGYHAFVLKYSVYGAEAFNREFKALSAKKECQYPAPIREVAAAMLKMREKAEEWFIDEDRIAICGFSAGAHNCAMYATHWHRPVITDFFGKEKENFRPAACILGYCLSDYTYMKDQVYKDSGAIELFQKANLSYLGVGNPTAEQLVMVSPVNHVSMDTPPTFLWATAKDELVPVQHSIRLSHALADKGVPFEMHIFEDGCHGLSLATQATAGCPAHRDADAEKWLGLADAWLKKRFSIHVEES